MGSIKNFLPVRKTGKLINNILVSSLGLRITSASAKQIEKNFISKVLYFQRLFNQLKGLEGDIVECGVASGISLAILASLVRDSGINRHIWGFDCWSGGLPLGNKDLVSENKPEKEQLTKRVSGFSSIHQKEVYENLRFLGFSDSEMNNQITLVQGLFSDTLTAYGGKQIALLHIDANLYNSYMDVLRILWSKVAIGGIVAFDDYGKEEWPGAKRAVDDFLSRLPIKSARLEKDDLFNRYYAVKLA